jgi:hypothetical protein
MEHKNTRDISSNMLYRRKKKSCVVYNLCTVYFQRFGVELGMVGLLLSIETVGIRSLCRFTVLNTKKYAELTESSRVCLKKMAFTEAFIKPKVPL